MMKKKEGLHLMVEVILILLELLQVSEQFKERRYIIVIIMLKKMISYLAIKKCIDEYVSMGIKEFAIYPYGENGIYVKQILQECYDISSVIIIDNEFSKYNKNIIDFEEFKKMDSKNIYVILTTENDKLSGELEFVLREIIPQEHIINLMQKNYLKKRKNNYADFTLKNIIPELDEEKEISKVKVRILNFSKSTWNSMRTICKAFVEDEVFDCLVLLGMGALDNRLKESIEKEGGRCVTLNDYEIKDDLPDILIINHPYDIFSQIKDCRKYCKLIVAASMQLIRYSYTWVNFWNIQKMGFGRFQPDYYIFDSLLYGEIMESEFASENIIEMGNAKFDGIYAALQDKKIPDEWKKLEGKRVILWTTDHGVHDGIITDDVTFDLYGRVIFEYAAKNHDIGIIFRPHQTLINELINANVWSQKDLEAIKKYCKDSPNIVFDDTLTYDVAYACCDGIISDAFCGITCSALPTLKPICLTYRKREDLPYHEGLAKCYYSAYNAEEVLSFIDMVKMDKDTMLEKRKEVVKKYVKHFDGKNGYRIKEFIKEKYLEL